MYGVNADFHFSGDFLFNRRLPRNRLTCQGSR